MSRIFSSKTRIRSIAFLILEFLVVVVLPNDVGTHELPAVGAKSVVAGMGNSLDVHANDCHSFAAILFCDRPATESCLPTCVAIGDRLAIRAELEPFLSLRI
jgi:hypothetical protein